MKDFRRTISFTTWREKIAFSVGVFGKEIVQGFINLCIFAYCMHVLDTEPEFLCALYLGFHILGTIANPIIGILIDNTSSRFGKYRPWIFAGTILNLIALSWMYFIPIEGHDIYLSVTLAYSLWALSFFIIDTASWPILTIFSLDRTTRDIMATIPCMATSVGTYLITIASVPLLHYYPTLIAGKDNEYQIVDVTSIAILVFSQSVLLLFIRTKHLAKKQARDFRRNSHKHMLPPYPKGAGTTSNPYSANYNTENLYAHINKVMAAKAIHNGSHGHGDKGSLLGASAAVTYNSALAQNNVKQCYNNVVGYFDRCASPYDDKRPSYATSDVGSLNSDMVNDPDENQVHADISAIYAEIREASLSSSEDNYVSSFNDSSTLPNTTLQQNAVLSIFDLIKTMTLAIVKNDQLMVLFVCSTLFSVALGSAIGVIFELLNANDLFNNHSVYMALLVGCFLQITCMALYEPMVRMLSRAFVFNFSIYLFTAGALLLFFAPNSMDIMTPIITAALILINCSVGLCHVSLISMTVDTVDYGEFKLSKRHDALIFSMRITSVHLGSTISFFFFGGAMAATFVFDDADVPVPELSTNMVNLLIVILCLMILLIYSSYYKLNGSFYRNVLNNLQYLRQNLRNHEPLENGPFMLRYALDESTMIVKLKAGNQDDIIRAMVQKLSKVNAITSEHDFISDLHARLELGPCGVAEGIALPHAKSSSVRRATVVVATLDTPIDLGSIDGRKSDLIFMLASPDDGETHLKLLGRLSLLLNEPGFADKLRSCGSTTEIFERLVQCEKHVVK